MGLKRWLGTTSGVVTLAANWVGGIAPAAGDDVVFDTALGTGADSPAGDLSATALNSVYMGPLYDGGWGSDGSPLAFDADMAYVDGAAAGGLYLDIANCAVLTIAGGTIDVTGDVDELYVTKADRATLDAALTVNDVLRISYEKQAAQDAAVTIENGATLPAVVEVLGGKIENGAAVGILEMYGGQWTHSTGALTELKLLGGGRFIWTSGTIAAISNTGGVLESKASVTARTLSGRYEQFGGGADFSGPNITFGLSAPFRIQGGAVPKIGALKAVSF